MAGSSKWAWICGGAIIAIAIATFVVHRDLEKLRKDCGGKQYNEYEHQAYREYYKLPPK